MKNLLSVLLITLLVTGFVGCENCNNKPYFNIDKMEINVATVSSIISPSTPVSYDSLQINLGFSGKYHAMQTKNETFSFLPSAVASEDCDPNGSYGSKESFENITIIALSNFDKII